MTTDNTADPLDTMPPLAPKDATKEQIAVAAYETVGAMLSALAARADQTRAKNYVAMQFSGCVFPFDRAEIHLIRPDGMSPTERAEDLQLKINARIVEIGVQLHKVRTSLANASSGRVFSTSDDKAMVAVRDAALADKVPRPFEITIARIFRVEDEVVQKTAEVTSL